MSTTYLLTAFVVVLIIGIFSHMLGKILKIPSIVFLLTAGVILGTEVTGVIQADSFGNGIELLVCQIAKTNFHFSEEKFMARVNKPENLQAFRDLGIRSISPTIATAVMLDGMVGHPDSYDPKK